MKILILLCTMLLHAVSVRAACTDGATVVGPMARVAVVFEQPQHFTDMRYTQAEQTSVALLNALHKFMCEMGERYVPIGMQAEIKVTDIDLAGDFEPWRGPQFDHVRITRDIYPPRISLEFRLTDDSGGVVRTANANSATSAIRVGSCVRPTTTCATRKIYCVIGSAASSVVPGMQSRSELCCR